MTTFQRSIANVMERVLGAHIVKSRHIARLYEEEYLRRILGAFEIDCVFDVGANAGQYALMLRRQLGFTGTIISFEPIPALAQHLEELASGDEKWHIRQVALDRTCGRGRLKVTGDTQFSSLRSPSRLGQAMFAQGVQVSSEIEVVTSTLEVELQSYLEKLGSRRPYLKMDTQGHDIAVAEGAGKSLGAFVAIQTEAAICKLYDDIPDLSDSLAFFQERGFELSAFVPNNDGTFPVLIETDCIFVNSSFKKLALTMRQF